MGTGAGGGGKKQSIRSVEPGSNCKGACGTRALRENQPLWERTLFIQSILTEQRRTVVRDTETEDGRVEGKRES